ncbi:ATP synthase F(1) complex subunit gamma, mitochondrial-like [Tubulanus polymorphus]|uniref:ATP synthase F(1) complex subunit gamma, mitochondrial-like n=1 Tax=Tubulanus polymorphus TaxID=672921 RepID=UPI003DA4CF49
MFGRTATAIKPIGTQVRYMATLKDIAVRLKSVKNIQKITASMKMVSAAKFNKAERELRPAREYGLGAKEFYEKAGVTQDEAKPNHLLVAMTSDRGLCGACHSNICRAIKAYVKDAGESTNIKIICVGDKSKAQLQGLFSDKILMHFTDIGKKPATFADAKIIANELMNCGFEYDFGTLYYNIFKSVISYNTTAMPVYTPAQVNDAEKLSLYDSLDEDVMRCYNEYALTSLIYYAMKESAASEQSSRMTAMDSATKNAGEMIDKLTLTYNRTRQAVITRELIEIISGAAAV